jgi:sugar lactone lactonase YvrE
MSPGLAALPGVPPSLLGESPLWHPAEQVLYWCDIPGRTLHRFDPRSAAHRHWRLDSEPACCAPLMEGGLLLALRSGLARFDVASGRLHALADTCPTTHASSASTMARPTRKGGCGSARSTSRAMRPRPRCTAGATAR